MVAYQVTRRRNLKYDQNRTVHHLGTRTQFVDSKQATPTAFEI
jgi:hypothetical protein